MKTVPIFGFGGEDQPRKGRPTIKRDQGGHERWADAILPADAEAGVLETPTNRKRLWVVAAIVLVAAGILCLQLFRLQLIEGSRNLGLADGNRLRQKVNRAPRGVIYDRHKGVLVQNLASFDITVTPSLLPRSEARRQASYARVADLIKIPAPTVAAKAELDCVSNTKGKSKVQAENECLSQIQPQLVAGGLPRDTALSFDQAAGSIPGFSLDVNSIREYQDKGAFSALLGYTGRVSREDIAADRSYLPTDLVGKLGVERFYESVLRGQNGSEQTEVDAVGKPIKLLGSKPAVSGSNLILSLDSELQHKLTESIASQMIASGSKRAAGVAINPKNGEVLAAVNLPTYDNNLFAKGISQTDYNKLLNDSAQPLFNKVTAGAFPTGSIIKPLVASAALQEHVVTPNTTVDDKGALEVPNQYDPKIKYTFRSYEPGGLGVVNLTKAIALSSNIYFYTVGGGFGNIAGLGVNRLVSYYQKFGLGHKTGIDIPEDTPGRVPTPEYKKKLSGEPWVLGDTYNIAVGQGDLLASPLQMAVATAAIANGGDVVKPHLLKEIQDSHGQTRQTIQPEIVQKNFIAPGNIALVRNAMRQVVTSGTACCLIEQSVPVQVAAKTGTAETDPNGKRKPHAWFTAFAPFNDPQIVIVVLIENSGEGAQYAAPAVRETLKWCFTRPGGCVQ